MYYQQSNYYPNYYSAVNIPSRRTFVNPINGRKSMNMTQMIANAEKSVDTISSLIPLYQKVKPVIEQGKTMLNSVTSFFSNNQKKKTNVEHVEVEVVSPNQEENQQSKIDQDFDYRKQNTSSRPFFY